METKLEIIEKFFSIGISLPLLKEANLSESDCEKVFHRIKVLKRGLNISHAWQLALLTGRIEAFTEHLDKRDENNQNIAFYAICSESESVLQWIYKEHTYLIDNYKSSQTYHESVAGEEQFIGDYSATTGILKSSSLLNWILHSKYFSIFSPDQVKIFLAHLALFNWIEGLDKLNQDNPNFINTYGGFLIYLTILNKRAVLFQWIVQNLPSKLMALEFFNAAVTYGMLDAVNWFLEFAPPEILNYKSPINGTTILHLAGLSQSNRVFNLLSEFKKDLFWETDNKGRNLIEYALNSDNPNRLNKVLHFYNSTSLNLVRVPRGFSHKEPDQWLAGLVITANLALDINFNLQTIECGSYYKLPEEASFKLQRNRTIAAFEKAKPVIVFLLFMRSEIEFPLDIIVEISLVILPKAVPQETINSYRKHFFFKNNEPVNTICSTIEEDEDSQEEILGIDCDTLWELDKNKWQ